MSEASKVVTEVESPPVQASARSGDEQPASIILISYPKIVFLYPTYLAALAAAI